MNSRSLEKLCEHCGEKIKHCLCEMKHNPVLIINRYGRPRIYCPDCELDKK